MKGHMWVLLTVFFCLIINWHQGFGSELTRSFHRDNYESDFEADIEYWYEQNATEEETDYTIIMEHVTLNIVRGFLRMLLQLASKIFEFITFVMEYVAGVVFPGLSEPLQSFFSGILDYLRALVNFIVPGTKWCGRGNIADNENDLGLHAATDLCCKIHDNCPDSIAMGETKYGLENTGLFTRSSCSCDEDLYNCLKRVNSSTAVELGNIYFNVLSPQCFRLVDCSDYSISCKENKEYGTEYQWFYNLEF